MGRTAQTVFVPMMPTNRHVGNPMEELLFDILRQPTSTQSCQHQAPPFMVIDPFTAMFRPCQRRVSRPARPWFHAIDMSGFGAKNISVKIEGRYAKVIAKREIKNGEDIDRFERIRSVKIPEGVDTQKLSCLLGTDGTFILKAPYKLTGEKQKPNGSCDSSCEKAENDESKHRKDDCFTATPSEPTEQRPQSPAPVLTETGQTPDCSEENSQTTEVIEQKSVPVPSEGSSRCQSPTVSEDFDIIQDCHTETINSTEKTQSNTGKPEDEKDTDAISIKPLDVTIPEMTSSVTEINGQKVHETTVDMDGFPIESISIRCKDNTILLHAEMEAETDGMVKRREANRVFLLPANSMPQEVKATMNDKGVLTISVPLKGEKATEDVKDIPIATETQ